MTPFVEKYPDYADAVGIMAGVTPSIGQSLHHFAMRSIS
jgi:hypothetical protein